MLLDDGSCRIVDFTLPMAGLKEIECIKLSSKITAMASSDNQLLLSTSTSLHFYSLSDSTVTGISTVELQIDDLTVQNMHIVNTESAQFVFIGAVSESDTTPHVYIYNVASQEFTEVPDVAFEHDTYPMSYLFDTLKSWDNLDAMVFVGFGASNDVALLVFEDGLWHLADLDETVRIELPVTLNDGDNACAGLSLDLSSRLPVPGANPDDPELGPMPLLHVFTQDKRQLTYRLKRSDSSQYSLCAKKLEHIEHIPEIAEITSSSGNDFSEPPSFAEAVRPIAKTPLQSKPKALPQTPEPKFTSQTSTADSHTPEPRIAVSTNVAASPIGGPTEFLKSFNDIVVNLRKDLRMARDEVKIAVSEVDAKNSKLLPLIDTQAPKISNLDTKVSSVSSDISVIEKKVATLKEGLLTVYTKQTEAESFLDAKLSQASPCARSMRTQKLAPEQAEQRKMIIEKQSMIKRELNELNEFLSSLRRLIDPQTGQVSPVKSLEIGYSVDKAHKAMRNINATAISKSSVVDGMMKDVDLLMKRMGIASTDDTIVSSLQKSRINAKANEKHTRFKSRLSILRSIVSQRNESRLNTSLARNSYSTGQVWQADKKAQRAQLKQCIATGQDLKHVVLDSEKMNTEADEERLLYVPVNALNVQVLNDVVAEAENSQSGIDMTPLKSLLNSPVCKPNVRSIETKPDIVSEVSPPKPQLSFTIKSDDVKEDVVIPTAISQQKLFGFTKPAEPIKAPVKPIVVKKESALPAFSAFASSLNDTLPQAESEIEEADVKNETTEAEENVSEDFEAEGSSADETAEEFLYYSDEDDGVETFDVLDEIKSPASAENQVIAVKTPFEPQNSSASMVMSVKSESNEFLPETKSTKNATNDVMAGFGSLGVTTVQKAAKDADVKAPTSMFGTSQPAIADTATKTPAFGTLSTADTSKAIFGSSTTTTFGQSAPAKEESTPTFGQPAFGAATTDKPMFGAVSETSKSAATPVFGSKPAATTFGSTSQSSSSAFSQSKTTTTPSDPVFGATSAFGTPTASLYGQSTSGATAFGTPKSAAPPAFGQTATFGSLPAPAFGQAAAFGSSPAPAFGKPATFGSSPAPSFGQPAAFGSSPAPAFGVSPAPTFGQTAAFGSSPTPAFGQPAAFGSSPAPAFGRTAAFGSAATPAFGQTAVFGSSPAPAFRATSAPAFGQSASFGQTAAFGQSSTSMPPSALGSASTVRVFGAATGQTTSGFGAAPSQGQSVFGYVAATGQNVFGSNLPQVQSVFGSPAQPGQNVFGSATPAKPTNGQTAGAFSQFR